METWVKLEGYETSLERQTEDAEVLKITKCEMDRSCEFLSLNSRQAEMHFWKIHKGNAHEQNSQHVIQPRMIRIVNSSNIKEETNQLMVQPRTECIDPEIYPDEEICKPSENQTIKDVPKKTQRDEANSRYQGEESSYNKASLIEEVHHTRMQKSYSPNISDS